MGTTAQQWTEKLGIFIGFLNVFATRKKRSANAIHVFTFGGFLRKVLPRSRFSFAHVCKWQKLAFCETRIGNSETLANASGHDPNERSGCTESRFPSTPSATNPDLARPLAIPLEGPIPATCIRVRKITPKSRIPYSPNQQAASQNRIILRHQLQQIRIWRGL